MQILPFLKNSRHLIQRHIKFEILCRPHKHQQQVNLNLILFSHLLVNIVLINLFRLILLNQINSLIEQNALTLN